MYFDHINGGERPEVVNGYLNDLNRDANGKVIIFPKEIAFKSTRSRKNYCDKFGTVESDFGTSKDMIRFARSNRTKTTAFLVASNQTRANKYTYDYKQNGNYDVVARNNKMQLLDWHEQVFVYKNPNLYVYDNMYDENDNLFTNRTLTGNFKSKIIDFVDLAKQCGLPLKKIFIGGLQLEGNCRYLALTFLKDFIEKKVRDLTYTAIKFMEFIRGPRISATPLDETNEI